MNKTRLATAALAGLTLTSSAFARGWVELDSGDGYKSSKGVIVAKQRPQTAEKVLQTAKAFSGLPYVWAGASPEAGFDCSGYIYEVMRLNGYEVPRMADAQFYESQRVQRKDLRPGDMVFFHTYLPGPSHVGFYMGDEKFIHASSAGEGVIVSQMKTGYYKERFLGGGRPDGWPVPDEQSAVARAQESAEALVIAQAPEVITKEATEPSDVVDLTARPLLPASEFPPNIPIHKGRILSVDENEGESSVELVVSSVTPAGDSRQEVAAQEFRQVVGEVVSAGKLQIEGWVTPFFEAFSRSLEGPIKNMTS